MENPWLWLPQKSPFVLPEDAPFVDRFNSSVALASRIETDVIPEPYLGAPRAPVLLLNLNPGYDPREVPFHNTDPHFISLSRANLVHSPSECPFYLLNPSIPYSLGFQWWTRKLRTLLQTAGHAAVANSLLCVEYFPYHTRRYSHSKTPFPSQAYSFALAREAAIGAKAIVLMRGSRFWLSVLPSLRSDPRLILLRSAQNVAISPGNCTTGYQLLEEIVLAQR